MASLDAAGTLCPWGCTHLGLKQSAAQRKPSGGILAAGRSHPMDILEENILGFLIPGFLESQR